MAVGGTEHPTEHFWRRSPDDIGPRTAVLQKNFRYRLLKILCPVPLQAPGDTVCCVAEKLQPRMVVVFLQLGVAFMFAVN